MEPYCYDDRRWFSQCEGLLAQMEFHMGAEVVGSAVWIPRCRLVRAPCWAQTYTLTPCCCFDLFDTRLALSVINQPHPCKTEGEPHDTHRQIFILKGSDQSNQITHALIGSYIFWGNTHCGQFTVHVQSESSTFFTKAVSVNSLIAIN